jgi:hypothetical protein
MLVIIEFIVSVVGRINNFPLIFLIPYIRDSSKSDERVFFRLKVATQVEVKTLISIKTGAVATDTVDCPTPNYSHLCWLSGLKQLLY